MDDRTQIPNIGAALTGPTGASIGEQGRPDPRNMVNIAFPPSDVEQQASQIALLAQLRHKSCPPNLFQTFNGLSPQIASYVQQIDLGGMIPQWWIIDLLGTNLRPSVAIQQGFAPPAAPLSSVSTTATTSYDWSGLATATAPKRIVLPGTSNLLYLVFDANGDVNHQCYWNVAAVGADYDPSKVY